jgi:exosortase
MQNLKPIDFVKRNAHFILLAGVVLWCYYTELATLVSRWWDDSDYIYGFLVIPFSVYLLRHRRALLEDWDGKGSWWGMAFILLSILIRCASAYMSDPIFGPISVIPCLAGIVLLIGGWKALRWSWPAIVFLIFMVPLPSFVATIGNLVLQRIATILSTFSLQTLGIPSVAYGNIIQMADGQLSVAQACSGLRSTMLFFAVSVGAAFLVRGIPEKVVVLLSAIPATIAANVFRITSTGIIHELLNAELADAVFHDLFGFVMLPIASLIVWAEISLIRRLLVHEDEDMPLPIGNRFAG